MSRPEPEPLPDEFARPLADVAPRLPHPPRVVWYRQVSSTNDVAASLAAGGAPEATVVIAEAQSAGRGRLGRQWESPAGAGLYASIVLRPRGEVPSLLTLAVGVAVAEAIERATGLAPTVKWPNDVYVGSRKLAGILTEAETSTAGMHHVIVGFGINVAPGAYPPEVAARATSLEAELGRPVDRGLVMAECLAAAISRYAELREGRADTVVAAWRARAAGTFGRRVAWDDAGSTKQGIADGIDRAGALLVRTERGVERLISGEVRWLS